MIIIAPILFSIVTYYEGVWNWKKNIILLEDSEYFFFKSTCLLIHCIHQDHSPMSVLLSEGLRGHCRVLIQNTTETTSANRISTSLYGVKIINGFTLNYSYGDP